MGLLGLLAMPLGFDGLFWRLMGDGIEWMIGVALFVASLPGAVGRMAAFGVGPLLLGTGGLLLLCLLKSPLRWSGSVVVVIASLWAVRAPLPDVLVSSDGVALAVRGARSAWRRWAARRASHGARRVCGQGMARRRR